MPWICWTGAPGKRGVASPPPDSFSSKVAGRPPLLVKVSASVVAASNSSVSRDSGRIRNQPAGCQVKILAGDIVQGDGRSLQV